MRPVQFFSDEYLQICKEFTIEQIVLFVEDFRVLFGEEANHDKLLHQENLFPDLKSTVIY